MSVDATREIGLDPRIFRSQNSFFFFFHRSFSLGWVPQTTRTGSYRVFIRVCPRARSSPVVCGRPRVYTTDERYAPAATYLPRAQVSVFGQTGRVRVGFFFFPIFFPPVSPVHVTGRRFVFRTEIYPFLFRRSNDKYYYTIIAAYVYDTYVYSYSVINFKWNDTFSYTPDPPVLETSSAGGEGVPKNLQTAHSLYNNTITPWPYFYNALALVLLTIADE